LGGGADQCDVGDRHVPAATAVKGCFRIELRSSCCLRIELSNSLAHEARSEASCRAAYVAAMHSYQYKKAAEGGRFSSLTVSALTSTSLTIAICSQPPTVHDGCQELRCVGRGRSGKLDCSLKQTRDHLHNCDLCSAAHETTLLPDEYFTLSAFEVPFSCSYFVSGPAVSCANKRLPLIRATPTPRSRLSTPLLAAAKLLLLQAFAMIEARASSGRSLLQGFQFNGESAW